MKTILLGLLLAAPSFAATLAFDDIGARVNKANPELRAARWMIAEARARQLGAGRLQNPELEIQMSDGRRGDRAMQAMVMQRFPLTGRLHLEKAVTGTAIAAAEAEVADKRRMLVAEAEAMALKVQALRRRIEIAESRAKLADELAAVATARVAADGASLQASQLRLDAVSQRTDIRMMDVEAAGMTEQLKGMLGVPVAEPLSLAGALPQSTPVPVASGVNQRADVRAARLRANAAEQAIGAAEARRYEDVGVGVGGEVARRDGMDDSMVMLKLSVPLPLWNKNEGEIAESKAMAGRAKDETAATLRKAQAESAAARAELDRMRPLVNELRDTILPMAQEQLTRTREAWVRDAANFDDLQRARDQLLKVETSIADAQRDYHIALARWRAATSNF